MTVTELIESLKKLPGDTVVVRQDFEWGYFEIDKIKVAEQVDVNRDLNKPTETIKKVVIL